MDLNVYDTELNMLGMVDEITSLLWIRRYWNAGEFKLLLPYTERHVQLLEKNNLLMPHGGVYAGQIKYIHIAKDAFGMENLEIQGSLLEGWLGKRLVLSRIATTASAYSILNRIVTENLVAPANPDRKIAQLSVLPNAGLTGEPLIEYISEPYATALKAGETLAKAAALGFEIITDVRAKQHGFKVYKGRDLTAGQTTNPPCIFSQDFDNVLEQEYTHGTENLRTAAYVGGKEDNTGARTVVAVGGGAGLARAEVFVNATDIDVTLPDFQTLLANRGMDELAGRTETLSFNSRINPHGHLQYMEDYDVGDVVTCLDRRWGVRIDVRITEVTEVFQKDSVDVEVTFGEALPTLMDKIGR